MRFPTLPPPASNLHTYLSIAGLSALHALFVFNLTFNVDVVHESQTRPKCVFGLCKIHLAIKTTCQLFFTPLATPMCGSVNVPHSNGQLTCNPVAVAVAVATLFVVEPFGGRAQRFTTLQMVHENSGKYKNTHIQQGV